jgi:predicted transcriptional regulator of viral defense system
MTGRPDWERLHATAVAQEGLFTVGQAEEAGYSAQLIVHHVKAGRMVRMGRGIYGLAQAAGDQQELVLAWLWSEQVGVVSHATALALLGLSDVLPAQIHLTLPVAWRRRRLKRPDGVVLHHADVPANERTWVGAAPVTGVRRTLIDCAGDGLSPELLRQATSEALARGLVTREELGPVMDVLRPFGGLGV